MGNPIDIQVGIQGASSARRVQVVLEYDATALLVLGPAQPQAGRAEVTLRNAAAGEEFEPAEFRFDVIVSDKQATSVIAIARAFDAAGNTVQILPPAQREIMLRP
jgi:hypothetical protein